VWSTCSRELHSVLPSSDLAPNKISDEYSPSSDFDDR